MKYSFHTCDVFTDVRFGGNPLAIVLGADDLSGEQMQIVAKEFNLSETVFVLAREKSENTARVRIFTPQRELPFAGHPTIGCACLVALLSQAEGDFDIEVRLEEAAGIVPVRVRLSAGKPSAQLTAPGLPEISRENLDHYLIAQGFSLTPDDIGFSNHHAQAVTSSGNVFQFVPVKDLDALSRVNLSFPSYGDAETSAGAMCTVAYTHGGVDEATDFSLRVFAPCESIAEDPATGSAAATFPGQLALFQNLDYGSHTWRLEQGVDMGRPSKLLLEADRHNCTFTKIRVAGSVVFVSQGEIEI